MGDAESARQARALEGILAQLTFVVNEMRKQSRTFEAIHEELQQIGILPEVEEKDENQLSFQNILRERQKKAAVAAGSYEPMLIPLPSTPYIVVEKFHEEEDGTHFLGTGYYKSQEMKVTGVFKGFVLPEGGKVAQF